MTLQLTISFIETTLVSRMPPLELASCMPSLAAFQILAWQMTTKFYFVLEELSLKRKKRKRRPPGPRMNRRPKKAREAKLSSGHGTRESAETWVTRKTESQRR